MQIYRKSGVPYQSEVGAKKAVYPTNPKWELKKRCTLPIRSGNQKRVRDSVYTLSLFFLDEVRKNMKLFLYTIDSKYCDFLREFDKHVAYNKDEKETRPFVGVLLNVNNIEYYAPLGSPKPKHMQMKNQADFHKINSGVWGVINFNNMIPAPANVLEKINPNKYQTKDIAYKNLLENQLTWCNANKDIIIKKATDLHKKVCKLLLPSRVLERCCNFKLLEEKYIEFCRLHKI